jgi:hypothetical protein
MNKHFFCLGCLLTISPLVPGWADAPFAAVGPTSVVSGSGQQSTEFVARDKGYIITFPPDWQWQRNFMGLDVFAPAPAKSEEVGSLANISVVSGRLDGHATLDSFFNTNLDNLKKALHDVEIVSNEKVVLNGVEGRKVVYSHSMGEIKLRVAQYFILHKGHGFIITCTAAENDFPEYSNAFETSVRTFKLI